MDFSNSLVLVNGVSKSYGNRCVLQGINLSINQAEVVCIIGPSGAGKSTLLHILGTLDKPDEGSIQIGGVNPFTLSENKLSQFRNQTLGFVFQFHQLLPELSAIENVMLPALIAGHSKANATKSALQLLDLLGVEARKNAKPSELSGGEQQRFAVARALINKPKLVLADEPSGNLDTANADSLHALFFDLRKQFNTTFVVVTHNLNLAEKADRTIVLRDGKMQ